VQGSLRDVRDGIRGVAKIKKACRDAGIEVKKNDLLRVALAQVGNMDAPSLKPALDALPPLKNGRPGKDK
jgi:hypothetical protein